MAIYFLLGRLTETGQRMAADNPNHAADAARELDVPGAQLLGQYPVLGHYDTVAMVQAERNQDVAKLSAVLGNAAGFHFETLSGVSPSFMEQEGGGREGDERTGAEAEAPRSLEDLLIEEEENRLERGRGTQLTGARQAPDLRVGPIGGREQPDGAEPDESSAPPV